MAITKEEIIAKCSAEMIASRDCHAIAAKVSEGRVCDSGLEIGNGTIIAELQDLEAANTLLDILHEDPRFKYIVPLLDQGRLIISSAMVRDVLQSFVPVVLTQTQADRLIKLGVTSAPVTANMVSEVLFNDDGSLK